MVGDGVGDVKGGCGGIGVARVVKGDEVATYILLVEEEMEESVIQFFQYFAVPIRSLVADFRADALNVVFEVGDIVGIDITDKVADFGLILTEVFYVEVGGECHIDVEYMVLTHVAE